MTNSIKKEQIGRILMSETVVNQIDVVDQLSADQPAVVTSGAIYEVLSCLFDNIKKIIDNLN